MFRHLSHTFIFGILALLAALPLFAYLLRQWEWPLYESWLAGWSGSTFLMYGIDKMLAERRKLRVPRRVLHGMALVGGFPGALLGMVGFWHKVRHLTFWFVVMLSAFLHATLLYYMSG